MSSLKMPDRRRLENLLGMGGGSITGFTNRTFQEFVQETVGIDIEEGKYTHEGTSKANRLRSFWRLEPDPIVGELLVALINYQASLQMSPSWEYNAAIQECHEIAERPLANGSGFSSLHEKAKVLSATHLIEQLRRLEASIEKDPALAIGTAKELVETCCKTILAERGKPVAGTPDVSTLTKDTFKELKLVPDHIPDATRGADIIRRLLSNLGTIGNNLAELRNLYGTGHGKHGKSTGLNARHAKLAVGAAGTLAVFLFETHEATKSTPTP